MQMQGGNNNPQNGNERGFFSNLIPGYSSAQYGQYPGYPPHGYPQPAPQYQPGAYPYPPPQPSGYPSPGTYPGHGSYGNMAAPLLAGGALAAVPAYGAYQLSHGNHHHGHHHHGHDGFGMHHGYGHDGFGMHHGYGHDGFGMHHGYGHDGFGMHHGYGHGHH